jgi:hypothetical protein
MEIGASIFFTDYSMAPTDLAVALEQRGFDSLWVAEHSHMPVTRRFTHPLGEAALTKEYFDVMDPFVTLSAAAAVTTRLKLATAICLLTQRDTIQTAKLVASLDRVSKGRFLFGIGCGWNAEEMENHGTVYETRTLKMREQIEAMGDLDQGHCGVSRPDRRFFADAELAKAGATTASSGNHRWCVPPRCASNFDLPQQVTLALVASDEPKKVQRAKNESGRRTSGSSINAKTNRAPSSNSRSLYVKTNASRCVRLASSLIVARWGSPAINGSNLPVWASKNC